jgi:predicted nucleic acid-binding protein
MIRIDRFVSPWTVGRVVFDTSCFIEKEKGRPAIIELERLRELFIIEIVKTDVVDSELTEKYNVRIGDEFDISAAYVELNGILYCGESRLNHAVLGTEAEDAEVREIARILKPGTERVQPHDFRDARHLATARKYGCIAFVTTDKNILKRAAELQEQCGLCVLNPEAALARILELVRRRDRHLEDE